MPGPLFRQESELSFPKAEIRRELADALLRKDVDENTRRAFAVGFTNLELFLPQDDYTRINAFVGTIWNSRNFELSEHARRGEDISKEMRALAEEIVGVSNYQPIWKQVINRLVERGYQIQVLKSISSGELDPNMRQLMAKYDKDVDDAGKRVTTQ